MAMDSIVPDVTTAMGPEYLADAAVGVVPFVVK
jgi:hypothetical protein